LKDKVGGVMISSPAGKAAQEMPTWYLPWFRLATLSRNHPRCECPAFRQKTHTGKQVKLALQYLGK